MTGLLKFREWNRNSFSRDRNRFLQRLELFSIQIAALVAQSITTSFQTLLFLWYFATTQAGR